MRGVKMGVVTLKDIAKECGLSFSAVSKALRGSSEIGAETRQKVEETAHRLGYTVNVSARMLRTKSSKSIGIIFEDITGSGLQHQYFAQIFDSMNVTANSRGYDLIFLNGTRHDYYYDMKSRGCDGVVICATDFARPDVKKILSEKVPVAVLDCDIEGIPSVLSDNEAGVRSLVRHILALGHKKVAFIHGESSFVTRERMDTFVCVMEEAGCSVPGGYLLQGRYHDPALSGEATEHLLSLPDIPTCIIYPDDFSALGGIQALAGHCLIPHRDISIAGYDGILLSQLLTPPLTTYEQNARELGIKLIDLLLKSVSGTDVSSATVRIKGRLIQGGSVCDIR